MTIKVRLYQLATDLGIPNADLVKRCRLLGFNVRNHMSSIDEPEVAILRRAIEKEHQKPVKEKLLRAGVLLRKGVAKPKPAPAPEAAGGDAGIPAGEAPRAPVTSARAAAEAAWQGAAAAGAAEEQEDAGVTGEPAHEPAPEEPEAPMPAREPEPSEPAQEPEPGAREAAAQADGAGGGEADAAGPRIIGQIELPRTPGRPGRPGRPGAAGASSEFADAAARKAGVVTPVVDDKKPGRRMEEMRAAPATTWDSRLKRPRKKKVAPGTKMRKTEITTPKASKRVVRIEGQITLQDLAKSMEVKATEVLMKLIQSGMTGVNINSSLDVDTAKIIAAEFSYEVEDTSFEEEGVLQAPAVEGEEEPEGTETRAPIVTVMGHVDHGKTSLLDRIRKTRVAKDEAGGITQSIGASEIRTEKGRIVFVDTPGHEAFTAMRARGANVTDIVILVVAANDGVQAQTIESIDHARSAGVPIVVAINKMDLPNANPDRVRKELANHGILGEDWGGEALFAEVSAETGAGIEKLLENVLLQAEILDLRATPDRAAHGTVVEAQLDKGKGPVATVLVVDGTLRTGDSVVAGPAFGRVRAMSDFRGKPVREALPATVVEIQGLNRVPNSGDPVDMVPDLKKAQMVADSRASKFVASEAVETLGGTALTDMLSRIQAGEKTDLKLILKADVQGSLEAVKAAILKLATEKVGTSIIHASVGGINETDVNLASASGAIIVGFNVRPTGKARLLAESGRVEMKLHTVIYDLLDELKRAMIGLLEPVFEEAFLGRAHVKQTFNITKIGTIAGCEVTEGKVHRTASVRLLRDSAVVWTGKIKSLRHFKDEAREVVSGLECGISLDGYNDVKQDDDMEFFEQHEREATL